MPEGQFASAVATGRWLESKFQSACEKAVKAADKVLFGQRGENPDLRRICEYRQQVHADEIQLRPHRDSAISKEGRDGVQERGAFREAAAELLREGQISSEP